MPSFDIVSRVDLAEVDNAVNGVVREMRTRFDFRDSKSSIERDENDITIVGDDEMKLRAIQDMLRGNLAKRSVDLASVEFKTPEKASGFSLRQKVAIHQGIDVELAKKISRAIKDGKLKVQATIQGDELRVTGKKRDDLQEAIALVQGIKVGPGLQYVNFRE